MVCCCICMRNDDHMALVTTLTLPNISCHDNSSVLHKHDSRARQLCALSCDCRSPKASEGVVDFAEECEARGTRVNFAAVRDYGARLASLARSDRAVVVLFIPPLFVLHVMLKCQPEMKSKIFTSTVHREGEQTSACCCVQSISDRSALQEPFPMCGKGVASRAAPALVHSDHARQGAVIDDRRKASGFRCRRSTEDACPASNFVRCLQSHYFQLLWCARQPADAGDSPAVCRMRRLAPSLDVLPVATRRW